MWNIKDYENFISFLNQEGINIEEYKQEFSEIVDKLNDIYYRIDPHKTRFKFSKTYNIFGFDVIGLLNSTCGSTRYYNHNDLKHLIDQSMNLLFEKNPLIYEYDATDLSNITRRYNSVANAISFLTFYNELLYIDYDPLYLIVIIMKNVINH